MDIKSQLESELTAIRELVETPGPVSAEKRAEIDERMAKARDLRSRVKELAEADAMLSEVNQLGTAPSTPPASSASDMASAVIGSEEFKAAKASGFSKHFSVEVPYFGRKTLFDEATAAASLVQPDIQAGVLPILYWPLTIADLMPEGTTRSNTVRYLTEATNTNAAATVAEGGTKPESALTTSQVDEPVRKIATVLPVTDEMLSDGDQIESFLRARLALFVRIQEEAQLYAGNGTAPNLRGLVNRAGVQTQALGVDDRVTAIFKAMTLVRTGSFLEPDALVIHPTDWQSVRLLKDGNGQFYAGGPFGADGGLAQPLWGLRVVVTTAATQGTALVGAFRAAAQIFRNGGLEVASSDSHSTFFIENKIMLRAEERLALAVYRPTAFCKVTGL